MAEVQVEVIDLTQDRPLTFQRVPVVIDLTEDAPDLAPKRFHLGIPVISIDCDDAQPTDVKEASGEQQADTNLSLAAEPKDALHASIFACAQSPPTYTMTSPPSFFAYQRPHPQFGTVTPMVSPLIPARTLERPKQAALDETAGHDVHPSATDPQSATAAAGGAANGPGKSSSLLHHVMRVGRRTMQQLWRDIPSTVNETSDVVPPLREESPIAEGSDPAPTAGRTRSQTGPLLLREGAVKDVPLPYMHSHVTSEASAFQMRPPANVLGPTREAIQNVAGYLRTTASPPATVITPATLIMPETGPPLCNGGEIVLYTDGSLLQSGHGGCGVAWQRNGVWCGRAVCLGPMKSSDEAELHGIFQAYKLANELVSSQGGLRRLVLNTDSQSCLIKLSNAEKNGMSLAARIAPFSSAFDRNSLIWRTVERQATLEAAGVVVTRVWIKGHHVTAGNEIADMLARYGSEKALGGAPAGQVWKDPHAKRTHMWNESLARVDGANARLRGLDVVITGIIGRLGIGGRHPRASREERRQQRLATRAARGERRHRVLFGPRGLATSRSSGLSELIR